MPSATLMLSFAHVVGAAPHTAFPLSSL